MNRVQRLIARRLIPRGYYCTGCPFHFVDSGKLEHESGYCSYLGKSDEDLNDEFSTPWIEVKQRDGAMKRFNGPFTATELYDQFGIPLNDHSLLWDGCKECGVKD